ncbi:MAG: 3,5-cyclic adenosine monophosphate phosphodiesterase CpdA [Pseudomonadota bacterium]
MTRQEWPCIAQLSDTHLTAEGTLANGIDSAQRLARAVEWILAADLPISACVVSGDLVDRGVRGEYERLRSLLDPLLAEMPVLLALGNHDARGPFLEVFQGYPGIPSGQAEDWIQYVHPLPGGSQMIVLDSLEPGLDGGLLCEGRLAWLERVLAESKRPSLLVVHHPALPVGNAVFDAMRLERPDRLLQLVQRYADITPIELILHGHVHRSISGSLGGIPVWVGPSTAYPYSLTYSRSQRGTPRDEPSALAIHLKPGLRDAWVSHTVALKTGDH